MPASRVTPKHLPVSPGQDSRFTIRHNPNQRSQWWVYYKPQGDDPIPADQAHSELVERINDLKESEGNAVGGSFSINEHFQVIARTSAPSAVPQQAFHLVDVSGGVVYAYKQKITFDGGALDPTALPEPGVEWTGPLCGSTYTFAAPGNANKLDEVWFECDDAIVRLSKCVGVSNYPPTSGPLADFLKCLRQMLPGGGRFRVNEHCRAFTSDTNRFIGVVPIKQWFPKIFPTD